MFLVLPCGTESMGLPKSTHSLRNLQLHETHEHRNTFGGLGAYNRPTTTLLQSHATSNKEDAAFAAANGAAFVGMILWPKAKRSIALPVAARVAAAARSGGAVPVGVFVDESAAEIEAACREAGVFVAQVWLLYGNATRHI
ncbi:unnamed protein product [Closterium sp. Yama58-4]|nr:unnamed protein product [Closterium sp. Yama58-4]